MGFSELAFSPDGLWLASGGYSGEIIVWDFDSRQLKQRLRIGPRLGTVRQVRFSRDQQWLAAVGGNGVVYLIDTKKVGLDR